jgi:peptidoglycan/LPS O-acetylase OafA/YrhL
MLLNYGRKQLSGLAWLRFGLALYLILFHTLPDYTDLPNWLYQAVSAGYVSTSTFFVLSGCVLAHAYLSDDGELRVSVQRFLATRFLTMYPLHVIGFGLAALIMWGQYLANGAIYAVADIPTALKALNNEALFVLLQPITIGLNAMAHLLLLHAWNPFYMTFNIPSWSISTLAFFYVVFALIGGAVMSVRRPWLMLMLLMVVNLAPPVFFILTSNFSSTATGFLHTNPLIRLPEFLAGIVLCRLLHETKRIPLQRPLFISQVLLTMVLIVYTITLLSQAGPAGYYLLHNGVLLPLELLLVILFAGVRETRIVWLDDLGNRLGNATLSIFILHVPVFFLLSRLLKIMFISLGQADVSLGTLSQQMKAYNLPFATYPFLVIAIITISVLCQERFVLRTRRYILTNWKSQQSKGESIKAVS